MREQQKTYGERLMELRELFSSNSGKIFASAAPGVDMDYYINCYLQQIGRHDSRGGKNQLAWCTNRSHVVALTESSQLGLPVGSTLGYGHIVPYRQEAQFQAGYLGKIKLAYQSPLVSAVNAEVVYDGDVFEFELGTEPRIRHVHRDETAIPAWYYSIVWLQHGPTQCRVMSQAQIERHMRKYAPGHTRSDSAWQTDPIPMGKNTVLLSALKFVPMSDTARLLLQREEHTEQSDTLQSGDDAPTEEFDEAAEELEAALVETES